MAFFEVEFPRDIGFTSTGGPAWSTYVNEGFSGFEQRNRNWSQSRAKFQIVLQGKPITEFQNVFNFYLNVGGMADAFRFYFYADYSAAGQFIATADGSADPTYQLQKTYVTGGRTYTRIVYKPIMSTVFDFQGNALADTVVMYDNGVKKTNNADYTVDATTGLVSFLYTPASGHTITADFQFHYPVRFDVDDMTNAQLIESSVATGDALVTWTQINLIEVRQLVP
jgi:uncharacterized protein (TIGR02217 family)